MYDVDLNSGEEGQPTSPERLAERGISEDQRYELMYDTGGHGGPYHGFSAAREAARRLLAGSRTMRGIDVVPYSAPCFDPRFTVATVRRGTMHFPEP